MINDSTMFWFKKSVLVSFSKKDLHLPSICDAKFDFCSKKSFFNRKKSYELV